MKLAQRLVGDGLHPRVVSEGYEIAKREGVLCFDLFYFFFSSTSY